MASLAQPPLNDDVVESAKKLTITKAWENWLRTIATRVQNAAFTIISSALTGQVASIGLTSLIPLASGLYRVSYRFRVSTAAGVSSSLQFTVTTTEGSVVCTQTSAAYTGNLTTEPRSGSFLVKADPSSPLQYSVTYASNPAGAMIYDLDLRAEGL